MDGSTHYERLNVLYAAVLTEVHIEPIVAQHIDTEIDRTIGVHVEVTERPFPTAPRRKHYHRHLPTPRIGPADLRPYPQL